MKIKIGFSEKAVDHSQPNFVCKLFHTRKIKNKLHDVGHMTKMAAMPIYVMNLSKYSPEPLDRFERNCVCSAYIKHIMVCINDAHRLTLTYLT